MDEQPQLDMNGEQTISTTSVAVPPSPNGQAGNGATKATLSELCYVILDALNAEDNLVPALSEQSKATELRNSRYVYVYDGTTRYFGQIEKGPIYTPEWGAVGDGPNTYPIVSGDKVEYVPSYYGYVQVRILGEIETLGEKMILQKTFHRPHPKAKISYVPEVELLSLLKLPDTDQLMGVLANYSNKEPDKAIKFSIEKNLIRKQLGIFGATGQGKSNTVLALAETLVEDDWCVIIFDHSGEYTECKDPSEEPLFTSFWRGLQVHPKGVKNFVRLVPVTDKAFPQGAIRFSVRSKFVPFGVLKSLLRASEAQDATLEMMRRNLGEQYDGLKSLRSSVDALPANNVSRAPLLRNLDNLIALSGDSQKNNERFYLFDNELAQEQPAKKFSGGPADLYDSKPQSKEVVYLSQKELIKPGTVIVVDFGNTSNQDIINIIALDILKKLEQAKRSVQHANRTKVAVFIEEAHTFFSAEYAGSEKIAASLTSTVKKIFKIGRKFYLNPVVISQQPSDVPGSILSQCTTKIIHQLSDEDDIRKVTKGSAKRYQNTIPDLRTGEALVTNSEFTTAQIVRLRPAKAKKIDPFLVTPDAEALSASIDEEADYIPDED